MSLLIEEEIVFEFIEDAMEAMRVKDGRIHDVSCPNCGDLIRFPIVARKEDIENIKLLLNVMTDYIKNDDLRKIAMLNFINELKDLKDKYVEA